MSFLPPETGTVEFFHESPLTNDEVDAIEGRFVPVAEELRRLASVTIRSEVDDAEAAEALAHLEAARGILERRAVEGPVGISHNGTGRSWQWGNAVIGVRNPVAPPMAMVRHDDGSTSARLHLGVQYEGPPQMVHGGVSALLLDHLMGVTASSMERLTMTGTLTLRYRAPLPLGDVELRGWIAREEGRKIFVEATISGEHGVAIEADGIFIVPSWSVSS